MCGRYHRKFGKQQIAEAYLDGEIDELYDALELTPSYNVAPTTRQPKRLTSRTTEPSTVSLSVRKLLENASTRATFRWDSVP